MSSLDRPLAGPVLIVDLQVLPPAAPPEERTGRTLIKNGPLRVTLITLNPGGAIPKHHADGPITVQPIAGRMKFHAPGVDHELAPGQLLALDAGVEHAVSSVDGATFLLTLVLPLAPEAAE